MAYGTTYPVRSVSRSQQLIYAISKDNDETAMGIIKNNPSELLYETDKELDSGKTPLHHALADKKPALAEALIDKEGVTAPQLFKQDKVFKDTALHKAIANHDNKNAIKLIEKGNPKQLYLQNTHGDTALHLATKFGNKKIALLLVNKQGVTSSQLSLKNKDGKTALQLATDNNMEDVITAIKEKTDLINGNAKSPKPQTERLFMTDALLDAINKSNKHEVLNFPGVDIKEPHLIVAIQKYDGTPMKRFSAQEAIVSHLINTADSSILEKLSIPEGISDSTRKFVEEKIAERLQPTQSRSMAM